MIEKIKTFFASLSQKTIITLALIVTVIAVFFTVVLPAKAQGLPVGAAPYLSLASPLKYSNQVCGLPGSIAYSEFLYTTGASYVGDNCVIIPTGSNGFQLSGGAFSSRVDSNFTPYSKAVAGYFSAEVFGTNTGSAEAVGVYARVEPANADTWSVALHGECRTRTALGGTCMGLNIELRDEQKAVTGVDSNQTMIGINVQPGENQRNVIGLQFQRGDTYKHSIDFDGSFIKLGQVDTTPFCMKFSGRTQLLEFWRGCGEPGATRVGFVNMNWGSPNTQINR